MKSKNTGRFLLHARHLMVFGAILFSAQSTFAQVELIGTVGSSHFLGDLGGKASSGTFDFSDLNLPSTRYMAGLGVRGHLGRVFALRAGAYYGRLSADDKYTTNPARRNRNLSFFAPIFGANAIIEIHPFGTKDKPSRYYFFSGIEFFHFDPRTRYNDQKVRLQPLGTEGQYFMPGKQPYALTSYAIPLGMGIRVLEANHGYWTFEISGRKTFTDYIDDVSTNYVDKTLLLASNGQMAVNLSDRSLGEIAGFSDPGSIRGHSDHNDNFFFLCISYNYVLGADGSGSGSRFRPLGRKQTCFQF